MQNCVLLAFLLKRPGLKAYLSFFTETIVSRSFHLRRFPQLRTKENAFFAFFAF